MSLINEALKRAELNGRVETMQPANRTHRAEHLYDEAPTEADPAQPISEEDIPRLFAKNQTSIRGAAILGVCVIAAVAAVMHLSLPPDQNGPSPAKAGAYTAQPVEAAVPAASSIDEAMPSENMSAELPTAGPTAAKADHPEPAETPEITPLAEPPAAKPENARPEPRQFTLGGILAGSGAYAIINNHMVSVGDEIDGARVIVIDKYHVVLEKDGKRLVLRM